MHRLPQHFRLHMTVVCHFCTHIWAKAVFSMPFNHSFMHVTAWECSGHNMNLVVRHFPGRNDNKKGGKVFLNFQARERERHVLAGKLRCSLPASPIVRWQYAYLNTVMANYLKYTYLNTVITKELKMCTIRLGNFKYACLNALVM